MIKWRWPSADTINFHEPSSTNVPTCSNFLSRASHRAFTTMFAKSAWFAILASLLFVTETSGQATSQTSSASDLLRVLPTCAVCSTCSSMVNVQAAQFGANTDLNRSTASSAFIQKGYAVWVIFDAHVPVLLSKEL
jgi:hypothetical protein